MYHYVYKTVNPINKKFYIGKHTTNTLQDQYQGSGVWIKKCKKSNTHLVTGVISFCKTEKQACKLEENLLKKYFNDSLNMNFKLASSGMTREDMLGSKNPFYGKLHSKKTKKILSNKSKMNFTGKNNPMYGREHTEQSKLQMSLSRKGKNTEPKSEQTKNKMSLARKRFWDKVKKEGRILKMGKGIAKTEEHKRKLSIATKLFHLKRKEVI